LIVFNHLTKDFKNLIADYENGTDKTNSSSHSKELNANLNHLLQKEIEHITSVVQLQINEIDQIFPNLSVSDKAQLKRDIENTALSFTGLIEVGGLFNSALVFHTIPHSLEVAQLSASGAEPDGPSGMLKAAAEGAYHDSRMTYDLGQYGMSRKAGTSPTDCEGLSALALIKQLQKFRGNEQISDVEKEARKVGIEKTVPNFSDMAPNKYGTVTNDTTLRKDDIFIRRDSDHKYKSLDGLRQHLNSMSYECYSGNVSNRGDALQFIQTQLSNLKKFRVGQADLSDVLNDPAKWSTSGSYGNWMEINRLQAHDLLNIEATLKQTTTELKQTTTEPHVPNGIEKIENARKSFNKWMSVDQPNFARGMATFREESNYFPLLAMRNALERMGDQGTLAQVNKEIATFEKLYCVDIQDSTDHSIVLANENGWNIKPVRRDGEKIVTDLKNRLENLTNEELRDELKIWLNQRTGRPLPSDQAFLNWRKDWEVKNLVH